MKKKILISAIVVLSLALLVAVGGTVAWLLDTTDPVTNTFSATDINVKLVESVLNADGSYSPAAENVNNVYPMIPGTTYLKDPTVSIESETNVDCYLFVKFEETTLASRYLVYTSTLTEANGWKLVSGESNVWYRVVEKNATTKSWHLLQGDSITINGAEVTKTTMAAAAAQSLKYTAYAIQKDNFETPEAAWAELNHAPANP